MAKRTRRPRQGSRLLGKRFLSRRFRVPGDRWSQVHYSAEIIQNYFELQPGDQVFLRRFDTLNVEEARVVYSTSNQNYKIELGAAREAGAYPAEGRPIVLFRRESRARRHHRYMLLMPGDVGHAEMTALAETTFEGPANYMRRVIVPRNRLLAAWPECPL